MSPRTWWVLAAVAGAAAAWAWAAADRWAAAFGWLGCVAFLVAGWREWSWRRAVRAVAQGLRDPRALEREGASGRELAAAVESVLREVREDLQRARARGSHLRELVEALPWGLVELDHRRRAVWVNRPAAALLGVQREQAADTSAVALFRRHEVDELLDRAERAGEAVRDLELGGVLQVVARRLASGGFLLLVQDVTQDRRAEAVRRDFVANVSHELRTPLASVRAMAEALRDGALEDPQLAARFLAQMLQEVDRMSRLVNDLLDLSALEAGVVRLRWEDLEAEELLEAVARRYAAAADRKGVALVVQPGKARVRGDRDRLEQALGNLVDNAVKYTPSGGQVVLKVELRDGEVSLVAEDTGPGIPPEHLPRVFERFYRADPSRSRAEGGTGLGLAITKHIALAHGGRVEAANRPTGGARLAVVLPAAGGGTPER
ncbi:MAG: ATP-binding protein [Armatimonadota bacterium]|nr:ATP-binding protein [Armatimonadota bacterium]